MVLIKFVVLGLGLAALILGSELIVRSSTALARRFGVSELVIGLTLVAFGTSIPELGVSVTAAYKNTSEGGYDDIAVGNVVGSNISNIALVLGLAAVLSGGIPIKSRATVKTYGVFMIAIFLLAIPLFYGGITRLDAIIMLLIFCSFILLTFRFKGIEPEVKPYKSWEQYLFPFGLILLFLGAYFTVESAKDIAEHYDVPEWAIAATIVAVGTSLPELMTSAMAALRRNFEISIGNIVGSNIFNIFLVLGIAGLITDLSFSRWWDLYLMIILSVVMVAFMRSQWELTWWEGSALLSVYIAYLVYLFY